MLNEQKTSYRSIIQAAFKSQSTGHLHRLTVDSKKTTTFGLYNTQIVKYKSRVSPFHKL